VSECVLLVARYYIWTNITDGTTHHIQDTTMTLFDADGTTILAQNDDGPAGAVNSYIEYTPTASIASATILVAPKTHQDHGTFQLQVSLSQPDLTIRPPAPPQIGGPSYDFCFGSNNDNTARHDFETGSAALPAGWTAVDDVPVSEAGNWYAIDNSGAELANDGWAAYEASNVWGNYPGDNMGLSLVMAANATPMVNSPMGVRHARARSLCCVCLLRRLLPAVLLSCCYCTEAVTISH
jgi:hypothetical protein